MKKLIVQKFGGSSLATPEQIKKIALKIVEQHRAGLQVIVVVSAMGKTTDSLMKLAHEVSPVPNRRELDMLLSTGERISMALLSMALHDLKCPSISFTGSQAGVMTHGSHSNALIKELKPIRVHEALALDKVVVLAGFQGVDPTTKEITTLGRGGSDTTAVTMADYFKAEHCQILKDVDGVFTADPHLEPQARLLKKVPGEALVEMCRWGAKVLHHRSVAKAVEGRVPLGIGRSDNFVIGTEVTYDEPSTVSDWLAVNSIQNVHQVVILSGTLEDATQYFFSQLDLNQLPHPEILDTAQTSEKKQITYTSDIDTLNAIRNTFATSETIKISLTPLAAVTITTGAVLNPKMAAPLQQLLEANQIHYEKFLMTKYSISFFMAPELRAQAVQLLHSSAIAERLKRGAK